MALDNKIDGFWKKLGRSVKKIVSSPITYLLLPVALIFSSCNRDVDEFYHIEGTVIKEKRCDILGYDWYEIKLKNEDHYSDFDAETISFRGKDFDLDKIDKDINPGDYIYVSGSKEGFVRARHYWHELPDEFKRAQTLYELGEAQTKLKKPIDAKYSFEKAASFFEKASELNPNNKEIWDYLNKVYEKLGEKEKAKDALDKFNELDD